MSNGHNDWGVKFDKIKFFERILSTHGNVATFSRDEDILFSVRRKKQQDDLAILCADEYACGSTAVRRALAEFGSLNIIYVGGTWCGYTPDAKEDCIESHIGLYNSTEVSGGLWKDAFWDYSKVDEKGNKIYQYKLL